MAAGLGGGSSNAANTLINLNKLWGLKLNEKKLIAIAAKIGSDVPFFIRGESALVEGMGDKIKPLRKSISMNVVLVNPGIKVSTTKAYGWFDKSKEKVEKKEEPKPEVKVEEKKEQLKPVVKEKVMLGEIPAEKEVKVCMEFKENESMLIITDKNKLKIGNALLEEAEKTAGFIDYLGKTPNDWPDKLRSRYDTEKRFNGEDQPIVGATLFAATVYCHWLTELNRVLSVQKGKPEQKRTFRLPTEQEWEWAASSGNRKYPWGDKPEPDKTRANFGEEVGHTTPVGSYPEGATPDGLMDMAGNVWEWMENLYGQKDFPDARALRGGSWNNEADNLPCSARNRNNPNNNWNNNGFRVVCVQS
ncbi:SUMF1/EgtB/PvdO family nonheme iron enzyme [candidate division KSB1 bacterium]|nr:SUMF1/EgtB/PvdO family nonheme iron enzyme [candidate division KSB1 bacterium]